MVWGDHVAIGVLACLSLLVVALLVVVVLLVRSVGRAKAGQNLAEKKSGARPKAKEREQEKKKKREQEKDGGRPDKSEPALAKLPQGLAKGVNAEGEDDDVDITRVARRRTSIPRFEAAGGADDEEELEDGAGLSLIHI